MAENLNRGPPPGDNPETNPASGERGDSNLGPPDYESALLTTRPRRLPDDLFKSSRNAFKYGHFVVVFFFFVFFFVLFFS